MLHLEICFIVYIALLLFLIFYVLFAEKLENAARERGMLYVLLGQRYFIEQANLRAASLEAAYTNKHQHMNFSGALDYIKQGYSAARRGWNGKNMFIRLGKPYEVVGQKAKDDAIGKSGNFIELRDAQGYYVPWVASNADLLSNDWYCVTPVVRATDPKGNYDPTTDPYHPCHNHSCRGEHSAGLC